MLKCAAGPLFLLALSPIASPSPTLPGPESPAAAPGPESPAAAPAGTQGEGSADGQEPDGDDDDPGDEPAGKEEDKKEAEEGSGGVDIAELTRPSPLELDRTSPRFVSREAPPFVMVRPGAGGKAQKGGPSPKVGGKDAPVDGSRWGFVDFSLRKKRVAAYWDALAAQREKKMADEKAPEEERTTARKELARIKALKVKELKALEVPCQVELCANPQVFLRVRNQDRLPGLSEKAIRDQLRSNLTQEEFRIESERPETWRGKRVPGHTFLGEKSTGAGETHSDALWYRRTYFLVPKPRNSGTAIVIFDCLAPKALANDQLQKEFEAFIRATQFTG